MNCSLICHYNVINIKTLIKTIYKYIYDLLYDGFGKPARSFIVMVLDSRNIFEKRNSANWSPQIPCTSSSLSSDEFSQWKFECLNFIYLLWKTFYFDGFNSFLALEMVINENIFRTIFVLTQVLFLNRVF